MKTPSVGGFFVNIFQKGLCIAYSLETELNRYSICILHVVGICLSDFSFLLPFFSLTVIQSEIILKIKDGFPWLRQYGP